MRAGSARCGTGCKLVTAALAACCACVAQLGLAQTYPSRPVRLIVNAPPGGGSDTLARKLSPLLSRHLGQNIVIDNRPGAAGTLGTTATAIATPDGHTLTLISSSHASNVPLYRKLPFHPVDSFAPVTLFALSPQVLLAHPGAPYTGVREMIAFAKANPGKLNVGSSGTGSTPHLSAELLKMLAGINLTHVPYKGGGPAMVDLMGGQIQLLFVVTQTALPQIGAGRVRPIAVASAKRLASFPDVPTIAESGVPGYEVSNWAGVLAPARTPDRVVQTVYRAILESTRSPDLRDWMVEQGLEPVDIGPEEFRGRLRAEIARWTKVVAHAGIRIE